MSSVKVTNIAHPSASGNNIVLDSGGGATFSQITGGAISSGTSVASTSGTSIDFTGIPSWVKRITVMFDGVRKSGSSLFLFQLGDSGGVETTGYVSSSTYTGVSTGGATSTAGFLINAPSSPDTLSGSILITTLSSNLWVASGLFNLHGAGLNYFTAGTKTLSDNLDRVRITMVNGTDTFNLGSINILYEG